MKKITLVFTYTANVNENEEIDTDFIAGQAKARSILRLYPNMEAAKVDSLADFNLKSIECTDKAPNKAPKAIIINVGSMIKIGQLTGEYKVGSGHSMKDVEREFNEALSHVLQVAEKYNEKQNQTVEK